MDSNATEASTFVRLNISKDDLRFNLGIPANLKVFIPIIYSVPLLLLYLLVIVVIALRLRASFYRIFAIVGLTDIISWITSLIFRRAHSAPFMFAFYEAMPTEGFFITLVYFWDYYNNYAQQAATFFLTFNRFTAVWRPAGHRKMWKRLIFVAYAAIPLFPIPFTWFIWLSDVQIVLENDENYWDGYRWDGFTKPFGLRKSMFTTPISIIHGLLLLAMNVYVLIKLTLMRRSVSRNYQSKDDSRDTDVKLFILTLIVFAYAIVWVTMTLIFYITNNNLPAWAIDLLFSVQSFGLDVHVLSSPLLLIAMSTAVREELRKFFVCLRAPDADRAFSMATASAASNDRAARADDTKSHRTVDL